MSPNVGRKTGQSENTTGTKQGGWLHRNMNSTAPPSRGRLRSNRLGGLIAISSPFLTTFLSPFFVTKLKCTSRETNSVFKKTRTSNQIEKLI